MGILSALFGNSKNGEKAVDAAIDGVDAMFYTDEERAEGKFRLLELKMKFMESTAAYKVARRYLAVIVGITWAGYMALAALLLIAGMWSPLAVDTFATLVDFIFKCIIPPFLTVMAFYFGSRLDFGGDTKKDK